MRTWNEGEVSAARYLSRWDSEGRLVEGRIIDEDGTTNAVEYTLDQRGDATVTTSIDSDGEISEVTRSRYDDQHHLIFESSDSNAPEATRSFKYDAQGHIIEQVSGSGETRTEVLNAYDEQGRPTSYRRSMGSPAGKN